MRSVWWWLATSSSGHAVGAVAVGLLSMFLLAGDRLRGELLCSLLGHKHRTAGLVTVKGWRPAALVVCDRCGRRWRGVRP